MAATYYRPYLTLHELEYLITRTEPEEAKLLRKLQKLQMGASVGLVKSSYKQSPKVPKNTLEALGGREAYNASHCISSPPQARSIAYHKRLAGEKLTAAEEILANTHAWEIGAEDTIDNPDNPDNHKDKEL